MRRPLLWAALFYAGGLLAGEFLPCPLPWLFIASLLVVVVSAGLLARARGILVWSLLVLAGWTNLAWRNAILSPHDLRLAPSNRVEIVTLRGVLAETPSPRVHLRDGERVFRSLARLDVRQAVKANGAALPRRGRVLVQTPDTLPREFHRGNEVEITGVLSPPPGPKAEGLFDYRAYLRQEGIYYVLRATTNDWVLRSPPGTPPWSDRFIAWAQSTLSRGLPAQDEPLRLLLSMALGLKNAVESQGYEPFTQTGTMHIFAISGLHIALIAGILVMVLRTVRLPRAWCGGIALPLIWFYTAATGWQPSAVRSAVMMSIIIVGWALNRPADLLNSLGGAAFIILLWDPRQLFGASFQLSFFVVLSIALLLPPVERCRDALLRHDPLLPAELMPRWRRWSVTGLRWISNSGATSLAAWLGALPLTAYYFHLVSPITLLANLLMVPLSSLALACCVGSFACGLLPGPLCEWFNHSAWFWMAGMVKISGWLTTVPGAFLYVRGPGPADFLCYYALLLGVVSGWLFRPAVRRWAAVGILLVGSLYVWQWQSARAIARIAVLPLDGGMAVWTRSAHPQGVLLVDTGPADTVGYQLKPFLAAQGVNALSALILSHGDLRHVGGAETIATAFRVKSVGVSPVPQRSTAYKHLVEYFSQETNRFRLLRSGDQLGRWKVLHPAADDRFSRGDDAAITLLAELAGVKIMLLSDLGRGGQEALLQRAGDLRADLVVAGLPAQGEPLCEGLLDAIQPGAIIIADSEFPAYERASTRLLERLGERNLPLISTRTAGAVTINITRGTWQIRAADGRTLARSAGAK